MLDVLNNILLSLIIALVVNFIFSYVFYKTLPLLTKFSSVFRESIKTVLLPMFFISFLSLTISLWILLSIPAGGSLFLIIRKVQSNKQKENFTAIKQEKYIPVIEGWILNQETLKIRDYHIYLRSNKGKLQATIYFYIESGLNRGQIRILEEILPPNTVIRVEYLKKKTKITHSYNFAEE